MLMVLRQGLGQVAGHLAEDHGHDLHGEEVALCLLSEYLRDLGHGLVDIAGALEAFLDESPGRLG